MFDLIIHGGTVFDGLGSSGIRADVAVRDDTVAAVGSGLGRARRVIDAEGMSVAPGFLDPHAHSDLVPFMPEPQPFKLLQGVTTEIAGNCGFSFAPLSASAADEASAQFAGLTAGQDVPAMSFAEYLDAVEAAGPTNHMAVLAGHNALRLTANGPDAALRDGAAEEMVRLLDESLAAGAAGLSSGLIYPPGCYSSTDELVALARVAHRWNRPYTTHLRNEDDGLMAALDEAIEIARTARVRLQVSHCKVAGRANHGGGAALLDRLRLARIEGVDVRGDQYPYVAASTILAAVLPARAYEGGAAALTERLASRAVRASLRKIAEDPAVTVGGGFWSRVRPEDVLVTGHKGEGIEGRTLADLAADADPWESLCDLLVADPGAHMVITLMSEDDVRTIMADPLIGVGSDSGIPEGLTHPRTYGTFVRFLGRYVRELGVVGRPEAIRKMTSAIADQFGLVGRGFLGRGAVADICVFDPAAVGHEGTFLKPAAPASGIRYVTLAGQVVVDDGAFTGERLGRVLRG